MNLQLADVERIDWDKGQGLVPAVVQHARSGAVLMVGYMNSEALRATFERGRVVFYSRSRQCLWEKGETSGNWLRFIAARMDCDADALLVSVLPAGPVCHTGAPTCFGDSPVAASEQLAFLLELQEIVAARIAEPTTDSYTARLFAQGLRRIAQKVGEEGLEVALAGVGESDSELVGEAADLLFHLLVLLRRRELHLEEVIDELQQRHLRSKRQ